MTTEQRAERKAEHQAHTAKMDALRETARSIVAGGHCPECGAGIHVNSSIAGWWRSAIVVGAGISAVT